MIQGLDSFPQDSRPTTREVNTVHLAWDVMVGLGTLLFLLSLWYGSRGCSGATCRRASCSCGSRRSAGVASVLAMEAGWVVTEVGRQPWIVRDYMKVEDAATDERRRVGDVRRGRGVYVGVGRHPGADAAGDEPAFPAGRRPRSSRAARTRRSEPAA